MVFVDSPGITDDRAHKQSRSALIHSLALQNKPSGVRGRNFSAGQYAELVRLLDLMRAVGAEEGDRSPTQVAINWLLCKGVLPIPGAKNAAQASGDGGSRKVEEVPRTAGSPACHALCSVKG